MSFGASQGTVRYALMVDDTQATQAITRFKTSVTGLAAPTNSLTQNMGRLNQQFTAGVTPIKAQGNALTTLNANLKATGTQTTGLGTKIKSTAGQFAGFATGLSATSSGVLQLAAGFRDYSDAQIAVERVTRKNSLAHEALTKAQDKLNALTSKGIRSGKAYEAAQLDVSQAQQMVSIQTQLLGEAQERLFDSQTQFVTSIVPTVLGAIGTMGFAFKELGGANGIGGLVDKFKGLGSIFGGVTGSMSGLMDKFKGLGSSALGAGNSASTLKGNLLGLGATVGVIGLVTAGALALAEGMNKVAAQFSRVREPVSALEAKFDSSGKSLNTFNQTLEETEAMARAGVPPIVVALDAAFGTHMTQKILENAGALDKNGKIILDFGKTVKTIPPVMNAAASSTDAWVNMMVRALKSADPNKIIEFNKAFKESGQSVERYQQILTEANTLLGTFDKTIIQSTKSVKTSTAAVGGLWKTWEIEGGKMASIIAGFGAPIDSLKKKFLELHNAMKPGTFTQGLLNYRQAFMDSFVNNPNAITKTVKDYKDLKTITDQTNAGAKALNQTWEVDAGAIAAKNTAKELEEARKKLEAFNKKIAEGVQAVGVTFKVKDNVEKFMKEIKKNLPNKIEKKIDMKLDFRGNVKDATTAFNSYLETATTMDEKTADGIVKGIIKTIDEKFKGKKGAFAGLRAQLEAEMKNPNTVQILKNNIANGDYTAAGKGIFSSVSAGITAAANAGGGLASLWENSTGKGIAIPAPVTTAFDTGIKTVQTTASTAVTNITTSLAKVSSVNIPTPNESIYQKGLQLAINNAGQTVKIIKSTLDKISGIKVPPPNEKNYQKGLQLAINNAAQTVKLIKKELDKVGGIKVPAPKFNDFNSALAQAVSDAKRAVRDINNALSNVKKKPSGNGSGPGATTGPFNTDTSNFSKSNSSSGGGDTIVYVNVLDETIMQKITRRSGRNRFTMGV